jgi:surface protein
MFSACYSLQSVPYLIPAVLLICLICSMIAFHFSQYHYLIPAVLLICCMFYNCYSLQSVPLFDTSSVTNMSSMFRDCRNLQSIPLLLGTSSTTALDRTFNTVRSLGRCRIHDLRVSANFNDNHTARLSRADIVDIFGGTAAEGTIDEGW